ncbi:hypothetical protein ABH935_009717 [Catenulispora sp. GAS73]|uniref:hypothetical protein n=1 Tax=Catenulispora sp. GAS73 TaxID=3156269 RepID=UPI003514EE38
MDDTRRHLRQAAEAHQPDREAMLARIEQGMAAGPRADRARLYRRRRQASWLKVALAGIAGVSVLGLGGLALAAGVRQEAPQHPAPVTATPTAPTATSQPHASATTKPSASSGPSTPHRSAPPTVDGLNGLISARADINAHSIVYWSQNDLTLDVAQPLSALTVELRIAQTGGVQSTGDWRTAPPDDFTVTVTPSDGYVVYRWTLKPGRTIPAAREVFAAQFNHATGKRDASRDTFLVDATGAGRTGEIRGGFPAGG